MLIDSVLLFVVASANKVLAHKLAIIARYLSYYRERVSSIRYPGYHSASVVGLSL